MALSGGRLATIWQSGMKNDATHSRFRLGNVRAVTFIGARIAGPIFRESDESGGP